MTDQRSYPEGVTSWVDVEQPDVEAAKSFYGGLFGWTFTDVTPAGGATQYVVAQLDGLDAVGIGGPAGPNGPGDPSGAVEPTWNTYVAVDDVDAAMRRVPAAGGRVLRAATEFGGARSAVCADPTGVEFRIRQARSRPGAQVVNTPGAWNFSDLHSSNPSAASKFYSAVFGLSFDDMGFATMIRLPGYGDHLQATIDPGIYDRQAGVEAPPGFADAVGWLAPVAADEKPHWHVTFTADDRDTTAAKAERLGATVLASSDSDWTREAVIRDPQGAVFTASQFTPPSE